MNTNVAGLGENLTFFGNSFFGAEFLWVQDLNSSPIQGCGNSNQCHLSVNLILVALIRGKTEEKYRTPHHTFSLTEKPTIS